MYDCTGGVDFTHPRTPSLLILHAVYSFKAFDIYIYTHTTYNCPCGTFRVFLSVFMLFLRTIFTFVFAPAACCLGAHTQSLSNGDSLFKLRNEKRTQPLSRSHKKWNMRRISRLIIKLIKTYCTYLRRAWAGEGGWGIKGKCNDQQGSK